MASIIVGTIVFLLIALALYQVLKPKEKGGGACGGCTGCGGSGSSKSSGCCSSKKKNDFE